MFMPIPRSVQEFGSRTDGGRKIFVREKMIKPRRHQSRTGHVESGLKPGGPPPKPKYYPVTDSEQYREGKVKRTPGGE